MFLEDTQIDLPYSVDAIARKWSIHGIADQSVRLFVGDTLASPSTVFQIVNYPNHAQAEAGSPFERLADDAFSWSISHNLRISEEIRQFGTISLVLYGTGVRISEALALTLGDVQLADRLLLVRNSKFGKTRLVPTGPKLTAQLADY